VGTSKELETDRKKDRQTDRQTKRQRERETERHTERQTGRQRQGKRNGKRRGEGEEREKREGRGEKYIRGGARVLPFTHILVHLFDLHPPHPLFTGFPPTHTYACRHGHGVYEVIDPRVVANAEAGGGTFFIAYEADPSDSGKIHSNVRQKWMDGDEETTTLMSQFATITDDFKTAVEAGDMGRVSSLMADNFALRTFIIGLLNRVFNATRTYSALRRSNASNASNACLFERFIRRSWMISVHVFRPSPISVRGPSRRTHVHI
jgi:hypothetical protein